MNEQSIMNQPVITKSKPALLNSKYIKRNYWFYILLIPGLSFFILFKYIPMFGIIIAFKDYSIARGILGSVWIGFDNFTQLFKSSEFLRVFRNSILLSTMQLVVQFPAPIILALMLNEVRNVLFKRVTQTVLYLPHFISWVVMAGMVMNFLSPSTGGLNHIIQAFGGESVPFLLKNEYFRWVIVLAETWKSVGWGTIVYLAALTGIDQNLYEAATIDGAGRFQKMRYITIPGIASTIVVLLLLKLGHIMDNGFEQIFLLYSPVVYETADVFETYTYRIGLIGGRMSFATAVGLFKSAIGFVLILLANKGAKVIGQRAIW